MFRVHSRSFKQAMLRINKLVIYYRMKDVYISKAGGRHWSSNSDRWIGEWWPTAGGHSAAVLTRREAERFVSWESSLTRSGQTHQQEMQQDRRPYGRLKEAFCVGHASSTTLICESEQQAVGELAHAAWGIKATKMLQMIQMPAVWVTQWCRPVG